jgi:UDP-glucose 4-epimerase
LRILVTGGAGYVGGFAARHLLAAGHDVVVVDNLCTGHREVVPAEVLIVGDIGDRALLQRVFSEHRIEAVMHFAASAYVGESVRDPRSYYRNNVVNTLTLLEAMLDQDIKRLVFSSTCAVYAETEQMPLREDAPQDPVSPYAFSKLAIERMIRDFSRSYGLDYVLLRYFNAAGASPDGAHGEDHRPETHLLPLALKTVLGQQQELLVFGTDYPTPDGTCIRDYVHVEDLALAHELALQVISTGEKSHGGHVFNIGTGRGHSVMEVLGAVERVTGKPVPFAVAERRPGDTPRLVASSEKIRRELGWKPCYEELDQIAATAWEWHRGHPNGYSS